MPTCTDLRFTQLCQQLGFKNRVWVNLYFHSRKSHMCPIWGSIHSEVLSSSSNSGVPGTCLSQLGHGVDLLNFRVFGGLLATASDQDRCQVPNASVKAESSPCDGSISDGTPWKRPSWNLKTPLVSWKRCRNLESEEMQCKPLGWYSDTSSFSLVHAQPLPRRPMSPSHRARRRG